MNLIIKYRRKIAPKAWIRVTEISGFIRVVSFLCLLPSIYRSSLNQFALRIIKLVKTNKFNFTFLYLKEVSRLSVQALSGNPSSSDPSKVRVAIDRYGLPTIIPHLIRQEMVWFITNPNIYCSDLNRNLIRGILTSISIYRVFPTNPKVSLDTITDPKKDFDLSTLPKEGLTLALKEIVPKLKLNISKSYLIGGESSGPNSSKSIWGTEADAVAFCHSLKHLVYLFKLNGFKNLFWSLYLLIMICLSLPFYCIDYIISQKKAQMGRLAVVLDQAGKARVVAITNWWIQQGLKPLHDSIFRLLKGLPTDGTFDQTKPLFSLMESIPQGQKLYGFDLSAATDRLPVTLQKDILNILGYKGDLWMKLLDLSWRYKTYDIKYSVGQPMGAYSSWAMLALTHHVIIKYCAISIGKNQFDKYCILGDDIVIADDAVSQEYLKLMSSLGVNINLTKSVISERFTEFAKLWVGPDRLNLSPIGPGLILQSMRHRFFLPRLITEGFKLGIITDYSPETLKDCLPPFLRKGQSIPIVLGSYLITKLSKEPIILSKDRFASFRFVISPSLYSSLYDKFNNLSHKNIERGWTKMYESLLHLLTKGWRTSTTRLGPFFLSDMIWFVFKPGFWFYMKSFDKTLSDLLKRKMDLDLLNEESNKDFPRDFLLSQIMAKYTSSVVVNTIDWHNSEDLRLSYNFMKDLLDIMPHHSKWYGFDIGKPFYYEINNHLYHLDQMIESNNRQKYALNRLIRK